MAAEPSLVPVAGAPLASPPPPHHPPRTTAGSRAELERRQAGGRTAAVRAEDIQHKRGKLSARERIDVLLDEGSFVEIDELARHRSTDFGIEKNRPHSDGAITGYGTVDGRQVFVYSQDFTAFGGSLGERHGQKIVKLLDLALKT